MANQRIHEFAEKVTLITDGDSPVGRAAALQLAMQGAFVIACSKNAAGSAVLDELRSLGTLANVVQADADSLDGAEAAVAASDDLFGRLDLLVNCLTPESEFPGLIVETALRLMSPRPGPRIVNVMSITSDAVTNSDFREHFDKLTAFSADLAASLPKNFRCNALAVRKPPSVEGADPFLRIEKGVTADDAARVITFLLSSEAKALNGQILTAE